MQRDVVTRTLTAAKRASGWLLLFALACSGHVEPAALESNSAGTAGAGGETGEPAAPESNSAGTAGAGGESGESVAALDCQELSPPPVILACAREVDEPFAVEDRAELTLSSGQVVAESVGAPTAGCMQALLKFHQNARQLAAAAKTFRVTADDRAWDVEVVVEGSELPSFEGQTVKLNYLYDPGEFRPTILRLNLTAVKDPSQGVWIAQGGELDDLGNLPLQLSRAGVACSTDDECGSYQGYDIDAFDPLSGRTLPVPYGRIATLSPWAVIHGGYSEQTTPNSRCNDWFVADVHVAILGSN